MMTATTERLNMLAILSTNKYQTKMLGAELMEKMYGCAQVLPSQCKICHSDAINARQNTFS